MFIAFQLTVQNCRRNPFLTRPVEQCTAVIETIQQTVIVIVAPAFGAPFHRRILSEVVVMGQGGSDRCSDFGFWILDCGSKSIENHSVPSPKRCHPSWP